MQNVKDELFLKKLGAQLRKLRETANLTQLDLALTFDNHEEQISRIERGKHNLSVCTLKKIADAYNLSLAELFEKLDL